MIQLRKQKTAKLFSLNSRRQNQPIATNDRSTKSTGKKTFAPFLLFVSIWFLLPSSSPWPSSPLLLVLLCGAVIELFVPSREGCTSSHYHTQRTNGHPDGKTRQAEHKIRKDRKSLVINYQQFENTNEIDARGTRHWRRERKWMKEQQKNRTKISPRERNRSYLSHRSKDDDVNSLGIGTANMANVSKGQHETNE